MGIIWLLLDGMVLFLLFAYMRKGFRDGFLASAVRLFALLFLFAALASFSKWLSELVYDSLLHERVSAGIQEMLKDPSKLNTSGAQGQFLQNNLQQILGFLQKGTWQGQGAAAVAEYASLHFVKPVLGKVVGLLLFLVLMAVANTVLAFVIRSLRLVNKAPLIGPLNRGLGLCAGAGVGLLWVTVLTQATRLALLLYKNGTLSQLIADSFLFQFFYNFKLF